MLLVEFFDHDPGSIVLGKPLMTRVDDPARRRDPPLGSAPLGSIHLSSPLTRCCGPASTPPPRGSSMRSPSVRILSSCEPREEYREGHVHLLRRTTCEMGIDVRQYYMADQSFTRAACVGCEVRPLIPTGVLKLESGPLLFS